MIGDTTFVTAQSLAAAQSKAVAFVRPHDIRITREAAPPRTFPARVIRSNAAGPFAQLELERVDGGDRFMAQLSKDEFQRLLPKNGEAVFVELMNVRVFGDDFSI
jgi:sulfate transport system ATP-binding protein